VLEVGCGTGDDARDIARRVGPTGHVVGLDNSQVMIAEGERRAAGLGLPVAFHVGDAMHMTYADRSFDAVRADRTFLGGAIAPGPDTMIASLLSGTQGIRRRASGSRPAGKRARSLFAADTASALDAGAAFAAAAFIDRACAEARAALGVRPVLLLTGGAAQALQPYIKSAFRRVPDLVLRGLAVLAQA